MINRRLIIVLCILMAILSIAAVSAAEDNITDTIQNSDMETPVQDINENANPEPTDDNVDKLGVSDEDTLKDGELDFTALETLIQGSGNVVTLENNYTYSSSDEGHFTYNAIEIDKDLTINGKGHVIDAKNQMRIFHLTENCKSLTLYNVTLKNGHASYYGGAIYSQTSNRDFTLSCTDASFINNSVLNEMGDAFGGAIYICSDSSFKFIFNCINSTFANNTVNMEDGDYAYGGAVFVGSSDGRVDFIWNLANSTFSNNAVLTEDDFCHNSGGAVYIGSDRGIDFTLDCFNSTFVNNTIKGENNMWADDCGGGAIGVKADSLSIFNLNCVNSSFVNNAMITPGSDDTIGGGAIFLMVGGDIYCTLNCTNTTFADNSAYNGGAIYIKSGDDIDMKIMGDNCTFKTMSSG